MNAGALKRPWSKAFSATFRDPPVLHAPDCSWFAVVEKNDLGLDYEHSYCYHNAKDTLLDAKPDRLKRGPWLNTALTQNP